MEGTGPALAAQCDRVDQETRPASSEPHKAGSQRNRKLSSSELLETLLPRAVGTHQQKRRPHQHSSREGPTAPAVPPPDSQQPCHLRSFHGSQETDPPTTSAQNTLGHSPDEGQAWQQSDSALGRALLASGWHQPNYQVTQGSRLPKPALKIHFPTNNFFNVWVPCCLP